MTCGAMRAGLALLLGLALMGRPSTAFAQDDGEAQVLPGFEPERGCPAKPDVVPFTPMSLVGLPRAGWLAHQALIPPAKDTFFPGQERGRSGIKPVPAEQLKRLGVPDPKVPLWVFGKADTAPCRAVPVAWWAVRMGTEDERQTYLMAELQLDCDLLPPGRLSGTPVALRLKDEPTGCKLRRPNRTQTGKDSDGLPPDMADHVPDHECAPPNCARLWEHIGAVWPDSAAAFDLTVSWLERTGKDPCNWPSEDFSTLLLRRADASTLDVLKPGGDLFGGLYDSAGLRYLLSRKDGVLYVYDPARLKSPPKSVRYATPTEEDLLHGPRTLSPCKK